MRKCICKLKIPCALSISFLLWLILIVQTPVFAEDVGLRHIMSEEEKALMPSYLESLSPTGIRSAPPAPIRNIAEFEKMEGVLVRYPLGISTAIIKEMAEDVLVTTIVSGPSEESSVIEQYQSAGVNINNCKFIHAQSDSYWTRDFGPWYVFDGNNNVSIVDFTYNRPRPNDNKIPSKVAEFLGIANYYMDIVHVGGNYMTDSIAISSSTDLVWDENPSNSESQIRETLSDYLGIENYIVKEDPLGDYIKHIDCWGKFLDVDKVIITSVPESNSNYSKYEEIADYFANQKSSYGTNFQVYRVHSPNGQPYTNSLILNDKVLVPITNSSADAAAIESYKKAMPGYEILGFTGEWLTTDALHCRAKGIPDRNMVYINHIPEQNIQNNQSLKTITAEIISYSGEAIDEDSVKLYYKINGGSFTDAEMINTDGNTYSAEIQLLRPDVEISYYIQASDVSGNTNKNPFIGEADPHVIKVTDNDDYCESNSSSFEYEYIGKIVVGALTNSSSGSGYSDFTSKEIDMSMGESYNLEFTPEFSGSDYIEHWSAWIDYNQDGDFEDSGEIVFSASSFSEVTGAIIVPDNIIAGKTRIRIALTWGAYSEACEKFSYGEVEDYTVNITK